MTPTLAAVLAELTSSTATTADKVTALADVVDELRVRIEALPDLLAPELIEAVGECVAGGLPTETLTDAVDEALRNVLRTADGHTAARLMTSLPPNPDLPPAGPLCTACREEMPTPTTDGMCSPDCRKARKRRGGT